MVLVDVRMCFWNGSADKASGRNEGSLGKMKGNWVERMLGEMQMLGAVGDTRKGGEGTLLSPEAFQITPR